MTTFEKIIKAITPFGYPHSTGVYTGPDNRWFTYNYADDYGDNYADDEPQSVINQIQLHFFLPAGVRKVRRFLFLRDNGVPLVRRSA